MALGSERAMAHSLFDSLGAEGTLVWGSSMVVGEETLYINAVWLIEKENMILS